MTDSPPEIFERHESGVEPGPIVLEALETLVDGHEKQGQEDVTVIGAIGKDGVPVSGDGMNRTEALRIPDSSLRVIPHCQMGDSWDFGFVDPPGPETNDNYLVSYGTNIMVQTASVYILSLATSGRMTLERVWRLAMHQGFSVSHNGYGFKGIDYGEISDCREQCPYPVPGMAIEDVVELESLGDVELVKKAVIHEGKFWIWMRPDRFPLEATPSDHLFIPNIVGPPSAAQVVSKIEELPLEVVSQIASQLPLHSLLSLLSTSRHLRFKFLGFESDRDALARTWIAANAPWYQVPKDNLPSGQEVTVIGWTYLRRCFESGSMRNRRRIWHTVEQIERKADELGI